MFWINTKHGHTAPGKDGAEYAVKKPTRWLSNSYRMLDRLSKRCSHEHDHQTLMSGRTRRAAFYPRQLVLELLRGMADEADAERLREEEQIDMQKIAASCTTFTDENSMHYRPSMQYQF